MKKVYKTKGTCSSEIQVEVNDGVVSAVDFIGGCGGNAKGIAALIKGMPVDTVIEKLEGLTCDFRGTSCPDQLARALKEMKQNES